MTRYEHPNPWIQDCAPVDVDAQQNAYALSSRVECGHRVWDLLHSGLEIAAADGVSRLGVEHLLLQLLRDPSLIPSDALRGMGLEPSIVFRRIADLALPGSEVAQGIWQPRKPTGKAFGD
ncbi:Clp protease N-terminal domain-containing protein [Nocardia huaxiensis]|uniref:Clp protease N-terminal domain-containing protein n=1 Tax=Nocardia huaxiensis TaxID=2755382 RepID=A0A7D6Z5F3_9NOCA|nr:Clp protease N-terminal domain-containing protein [Nocardia huaxiensis]QLY31864.1 Clp protease N-terminal domain-containing protein [Nocardia huaxiensis]UFS95428.1 Clp protease N-terminal domain-containing protein [Nocardia huaxiensis]